MKVFNVDEASNDDENFYVDVAGRGTVSIVITDQGLRVDIFSPYVSDDSVASIWASTDELMGLNEQDLARVVDEEEYENEIKEEAKANEN